MPAEIVTRDSSTWWRTVTINRGREDGVETDMPVVTDEGLVGKTTTVSANISVVLLVSDENCRVAATVEGTREQGIVTGERVAGAVAPMLDLNFLSKQANLKPGQKVYTSGVGGVFPSGLLVGTVQSFSCPRIGWSGAARSRGGSGATRGRFRGDRTQMIFFIILVYSRARRANSGTFSARRSTGCTTRTFTLCR